MVDQAAERARYMTPINVFRTKQPAVPAHAFHAERERALDPATPTGLIDLDLSTILGTPSPATTPAMLCRYLRLTPSDGLETRFAATGTIFHVIAGDGMSVTEGQEIKWARGDSFLLPGGRPARHEAGPAGALLFLADDAPTLAFYDAQPPADAAPPVFYPAADVARQLGALYERDPDEDLTGKALFLTSAAGGSYGTVTPSMVAAFNTLEAGGDQRPHRHNAAAISLAIDGDGVHSRADDVRVDWLPSLVMVTPPAALHSIHNRGPAMMKTLTVQDSGLCFYLRATGFSFG